MLFQNSVVENCNHSGFDTFDNFHINLVDSTWPFAMCECKSGVSVYICECAVNFSIDTNLSILFHVNFSQNSIRRFRKFHFERSRSVWILLIVLDVCTCVGKIIAYGYRAVSCIQNLGDEYFFFFFIMCGVYLIFISHVYVWCHIIWFQWELDTNTTNMWMMIVPIHHT